MGHGQSCCVSKKCIKSPTTGGTPSENKIPRHSSIAEDPIVARAAASVNRYRGDNPKSFLAAKTQPRSSPEINAPSVMPCVISEKRAVSSPSRNGSTADQSYRKSQPPPSTSTTVVVFRTSGEITKRASTSKSEYVNPSITSMFDTYRDIDEADVILAIGIEKLCQDLHVDPEDHRILILAWKTNASTMCRFTREEFVRGCSALCVDSMSSMSSRLLEAVEEVRSSSERFEELYRWSFSFALDKDAGQRNLPVDMAIAMWRVVFAVRASTPLAILEPWLSFLEDRHPRALRSIPRDTWDMFLRFVISVGYDLTNYSEEEAWPCLFDDFVEHENDKRNQNLIIDRPWKEDTIGAELDKELMLH